MADEPATAVPGQQTVSTQEARLQIAEENAARKPKHGNERWYLYAMGIILAVVIGYFAIRYLRVTPSSGVATTTTGTTTETASAGTSTPDTTNNYNAPITINTGSAASPNSAPSTASSKETSTSSSSGSATKSQTSSNTSGSGSSSGGSSTPQVSTNTNTSKPTQPTPSVTPPVKPSVVTKTTKSTPLPSQNITPVISGVTQESIAQQTAAVDAASNPSGTTKSASVAQDQQQVAKELQTYNQQEQAKTSTPSHTVTGNEHPISMVQETNAQITSTPVNSTHNNTETIIQSHTTTGNEHPISVAQETNAQTSTGNEHQGATASQAARDAALIGSVIPQTTSGTNTVSESQLMHALHPTLHAVKTHTKTQVGAHNQTPLSSGMKRITRG